MWSPPIRSYILANPNPRASFTTKAFPENWKAETGDIVRDIMLDVKDRTPVEDIYWTVPDYHKLFNLAALEIEAVYKPLGKDEEPYNWISETKIAPWMIFVLKKKSISKENEVKF